jgi:hypothetical protein
MDRGVLTLATLWIVLSMVAIGFGLAFPGTRFKGPPKRVADTLFFAWWIGIAALAWVSFLLANAMPLREARPWIGVGAFVVASFGLWRSRFLCRALRPRAWLAFVALALILAERSVAIGPLEDTGGYHWSIVQWYEGYGIPAGLALFQWRLATHSAWLALTALLDAGALEARVASVANGLLFLGCLWFASVCALRWIRGSSTLADRFALAALAFLLQLIAKWDMRLSTSPDIPVLLVTIVIGWKILSDTQDADDAAASVAPLALLSAFALTIKLNALPLVLVCASLVWIVRGLAWRGRLLTTAALGVILLPLFVASWTSTGCVLFPVSFGCIDGPSAVGAAAARTYAGIVAATSRNDIGTALVATLIAAIYLAWQRRALTFPVLAGPMAIAVTGIAFTALIAPTTRFAIGYLTIIPALAAAHAAGDGPFVENVTPRTLAALRAGVAALLALAIAIPLYKEFIYSSLRDRHFDSWAERKRGDPTINALNPGWWLIPNRIDYRGPYTTAHALDFDYAVSTQMTCWNYPQPCASNPTLSALPDVRLRDPARGLAGGFMRKH